jgi:transcriptional regulator with XRE-family HTH domain
MEQTFNIHLGKKLRLRRLSLGLTQTKVAHAINVTFQQIQKYEKGTNGVSSNRLMQLSQFLKVPITYFYEEYKDYKDLTNTNDTTEDLNYSFLTKTFSKLSKDEKVKILQVLRNTESLDKTG